jgi:6-phosphogluconolactonase
MRREILIGTYTEQLSHVEGRAEGIHSCTFDDEGVGPSRLLTVTRNPSFLALTPQGDRLYAVNETVEFGGHPGGGVSAFARDPHTGDLSLLNARASLGQQPCHLALDPCGHFVVVANYVSGSIAVFPLDGDGALGAMTDHIRHTGKGGYSAPQRGSHPHMVAFDPDNGNVLVTDLGLDSVFVYALTKSGTLIEDSRLRISMSPGSGPRHLALHPDGQHLFILNELSNTLVALRRNGDRFMVVATASTLGERARLSSHAGAVRVSPSGGSVLVTNRGDNTDSIAVLRFDAKLSCLELACLQSTSGRVPRDLVFAGDGRLVVVANQESDNLVAFEFDEGACGLQQVWSAPVPSPACLTSA